MPIYEYRCTECGQTFARLQRMGAGADEVRCPGCGSGAVERLLSAFSSGATSTASGAGPSSGCGTGGFT